MQLKMKNTTINKMRNRRIALFFTIAVLAVLLIYTGLLIQAYVTQNLAFELMRYSFGAVSFASFLALMIAFYMSTLIGTVLMLLSFRLSFVIQKPRARRVAILLKGNFYNRYNHLGVFQTRLYRTKKTALHLGLYYLSPNVGGIPAVFFAGA